MKIDDMPICSKTKMEVIWRDYCATVKALDEVRVAMDRIRPVIDEYGENYGNAMGRWEKQVIMLDDLYQEIYHSTHVLKYVLRR